MLVLPVSAAVITVDNSTCRLHDAIIAANTDSPVGGCAAGSGADTIRLTGDVSLDEVVEDPYYGYSGLPVIDSEITIEGGGFTIERANDAPQFRLITVAEDAGLALNEVTLRHGHAIGSPDAVLPYADGGAVRLYQGTVALTNSTITGNFAAEVGGGIATYAGNITMDHVLMTNNAAGNEGGALYVGSGAATLTDSTLSENTAGLRGGAIATDESAFSLTNVTVSGNAAGLGGGIWIWPGFGGGPDSVTNSTLSDNDAGFGGGVYLAQRPYYNGLTLRNSTVSGNRADNHGGGLVLDSLGSDISVENVTFSGNVSEADLGAAVFVRLVLGPPAPRLSNSIFADSIGDACAGDPMNDAGGNLADDLSCGIPGTLTGLDPVLADNGGPTRTHALLPGSSAIDFAGSCGLTTDQRGQPREDDACDAGSYEFQCSIAVSLEGGDTKVWFTPDSSGFDLVVGSLTDLLGDGDFSAATCLGRFTESPAVDPAGDPEPGHGRYYLARGTTSCTGAEYGSSTLTPDPRDPLAAGPCPLPTENPVLRTSRSP